MLDRQIFANFATPPRDVVELASGVARVSMRPCAVADFAQDIQLHQHNWFAEDLHTNTHSIPPEAAPGDIYKLWVDTLDDWALLGSKTLQLMFVEKDAPCRIEIDTPLVVEAEGAGLYFQASLASHRAHAVLHVEFRDQQSGDRAVHKVPFEAGKIGGRHIDGYQSIALPLPRRLEKGRIEVRLSVEYLGYAGDSAGSEPFVFLANVRIGNRQDRHEQPLIPKMIVGKVLPLDGTWLSAPLPAIPAPGMSVELRCGPAVQAFTIGSGPEFGVSGVHDNTLTINSNVQADLALYVDGTFSVALQVQPGETMVRMPDKHFDGTTHHLGLRDASGSVTYWEGQCPLPAIMTPAIVMQRESVAPFPDAIFAQTPRRYASLKAVLAHAGPATDLAQLSHALATVEGGYDAVTLAPLHFPAVDDPEVSIVIPAHNKVEVTYLALCSLLLAHNETRFEVIVVDDASTDETAELEDIVEGITVLHNEVPQRFIRACNAGVAQARGRYVALLNNDVEVTTGWLDELVAAFDRFDDVGLVGSKLLYPNGDLQDAGGIVWGSGNPWNYGHRRNPNEPRFCYARQADYLSGAALMLPKTVWDDVEGLSSYLEPMYFEDTDMAFKVRDAGYTTWFVPSSVVYHYEGMTSGTDVTTSYKKYQEVNRPKFKRHWAQSYSRFGREGQQPDLEKDRGIAGRVLFIDYSTPRPDQDAGSYAALQEIRLVQSLGYKVTFLPINMTHLGKYTEDLQKLGVEMIYAPFYRTTQDFLNKHAAEFDAFYITRFNVAQEVLSQIRMHAPDAKILFNNADLHFLREIRAARSEGDPKRMEEARKTRDEEIRVINQVDVVLSYNDFEHAVIEAYTEGGAKIVRTPWVVDPPETVPPLAARKGLSFLGSFRHHPNVEGITWFAREIMPSITAKCPDLVLSIYGSRMSDGVRELESDTIDPVGFVEEVSGAFDPHRIFVAPLRSGAGIKGKVLEALAHGIPCVLSPIAAEGIGLRNGHDCFIVRTAEEWAEAIAKLDTDDALWERMSAASRAYMAENFSFAKGRIFMREAFEAADLFLPEAP